MRRTFASVPSTIALIVALIASSAAAVSFTGGLHATRAAMPAPAQATSAGAHTGASEPDGLVRTAVLHALAPSMGRMHAPQANGGDGARNAAALRAAQGSLDLAARRAPGAAVDAREHGVTSPGQPAPSSRAPPIG
jgi:hypothetical protein